MDSPPALGREPLPAFVYIIIGSIMLGLFSAAMAVHHGRRMRDLRAQVRALRCRHAGTKALAGCTPPHSPCAAWCACVQDRAEREQREREAEDKAAASEREVVVCIPPLVIHPDCSLTLGSSVHGAWPAQQCSAEQQEGPPGAPGHCDDGSADGGSRHSRTLVVRGDETAFSVVDLSPALQAIQSGDGWGQAASTAAEDGAAARLRLERTDGC